MQDVTRLCKAACLSGSAIFAALVLGAGPSAAQPGPAYGYNLSGTYEIWSANGEQLCSVELTDAWGAVRESFEIADHDCPPPFDRIGRWSRDMQGLHLHNNVFSEAWAGRRPDGEAPFFAGEASDGAQYALRPISGNAVASLAGQLAPRAQDLPVGRSDVPGDWSIRTRDAMTRTCTLSLLIDDQDRNRVIPQGSCDLFADAATWRRSRNMLQLGDRNGSVIWSGRYGRNEDGQVRAQGPHRGAVWILERQGDASVAAPVRLTPEQMIGGWTLMFGDYACTLEFEGDGRIRPARECQAPGRMMSRWTLEGRVVAMWDSMGNRGWEGELVSAGQVIGGGMPGIGYGFPPRRIPPSELRR
jgi:hypothetical protein